MNLLDKANFVSKVSSVLNRNVKEFGKKFLFDGREDTCWNSDQGTPQWILIDFQDSAEPVGEIQLMFQGGFVGKECHLEVSQDGDTFDKVFEFFPEDINKLQKFTLPQVVNGRAFKVVFPQSTDFFGRITVYQLKLIQL